MAEAAKEAAAQGGAIEVSEFDKLMTGAFKPKTDSAAEAIKQGVQTLAEQALASAAVVSDDAIKTIQAIIAEIDKKLSEQVNAILHHEDFRALEGTWRGLHYLVNNTETDETLKIRVMNISKKDLSIRSRNSRGRHGTRARSSRSFMKKSLARRAGRLMAVSSAITPSITPRRMSRCSPGWRRFRPLRTLRSWRRQRRR